MKTITLRESIDLVRSLYESALKNESYDYAFKTTIPNPMDDELVPDDEYEPDIEVEVRLTIEDDYVPAFITADPAHSSPAEGGEYYVTVIRLSTGEDISSMISKLEMNSLENEALKKMRAAQQFNFDSVD